MHTPKKVEKINIKCTEKQKIKNKHTHKLVDSGGGTYLQKKAWGMSEVIYKCECGIELKYYLTTAKYIEREYPKIMLCDINFPPKRQYPTYIILEGIGQKNIK